MDKAQEPKMALIAIHMALPFYGAGGTTIRAYFEAEGVPYT